MPFVGLTEIVRAPRYHAAGVNAVVARGEGSWPVGNAIGDVGRGEMYHRDSQ